MPVTVSGRKGDTVVDTDEEPAKTNFDKIPQLRAVFSEGGTVTAANASSINDGAAALVVAASEWAEANGKRGHGADRGVGAAQPGADGVHDGPRRGRPQGARQSRARRWTTSTCSRSTRRSPSSRWRPKTRSTSRHDKLNVRGGSVAVGHPIGASGARILTTLLHEMVARDAKTGLAAICIGGGEATAIVLQRD